jgi:hypothetical protein
VSAQQLAKKRLLTHNAYVCVQCRFAMMNLGDEFAPSATMDVASFPLAARCVQRALLSCPVKPELTHAPLQHRWILSRLNFAITTMESSMAKCVLRVARALHRRALAVCRFSRLPPVPTADVPLLRPQVRLQHRHLRRVRILAVRAVRRVHRAGQARDDFRWCALSGVELRHTHVLLSLWHDL